MENKEKAISDVQTVTFGVERSKIGGNETPEGVSLASTKLICFPLELSFSFFEEPEDGRLEINHGFR